MLWRAGRRLDQRARWQVCLIPPCWSPAQARKQQLAVLGVAKNRQIVRRDQYGAQLGDDRARFGKPPHMGIARGENAVRVGIA